MVATTRLSTSIDRNLHTVRGKLSALPRIEWRLASEESPYTPDQRYIEHADLEGEWRDIMDRLGWLHQQYATRSMSPQQAEQHEKLLELIPNALPIIARLRLESPPPAVLAHVSGDQEARPSRVQAH